VSQAPISTYLRRGPRGYFRGECCTGGESVAVLLLGKDSTGFLLKYAVVVAIRRNVRFAARRPTFYEHNFLAILTKTSQQTGAQPS